MFDKIADLFEKVNSKAATIIPGWKTKLTGGLIIVLGNVAVATGLLEAGQDAAVIAALVEVLTNVETWLGLMVIYFRGLADRT